MEEMKNFVSDFQGMVDAHNEEMDDLMNRNLEALRQKYLSGGPSQNASKKKKPKQDEHDKENNGSNDNSVPGDNTRATEDLMPPPPPQSLRPVRTAKIAACKNLKEPDLHQKLRQPGNNDQTMTGSMVAEVKVEPAEEVSVKRESRTKRKVKKEKISTVPVVAPSDHQAEKRGSSLELIPPASQEIVEVPSDDEVDKMPPPMMPAPKTRPRRTKRKAPPTSTVTSGALMRESSIKKEKTEETSSSRRATEESQYEDALTGDILEPPPSSSAAAAVNNVTQVISKKKSVPKTSQPMNATFEIPPTEPENNAGINNSIMTEDNSIELPEKKNDEDEEVEEEELPPPQKTVVIHKKKTNPHELFNPCVQSPLRTEVEAFERHAAASVYPIPPRVTPSTPSQKMATLMKSASTSKLSSVCGGAKKKNTTTTKTAPMSASKATAPLTRSHSAEDNKRGLNALQQLAEEKRKKREERHKQAQLAREAREREKEEKNRRILLEQQQREEKMRAERLKALKVKQAQEQEQKMKVNELQKLQYQKAVVGGKVKGIAKYGFDMLCSDDSTDDEGKSSQKRPPAPLWSVRPQRQELAFIQDHLDAKLLDNFFTVQPMTANLAEIFPDIDPRNLMRNSSAVWRTPPRYSEIPK